MEGFPAIDGEALGQALVSTGWGLCTGVLDDVTRERLLLECLGHQPSSRVTPLASDPRVWLGTYHKLDHPLPSYVALLRDTLYARLLPAANAWARALGRPSFPATSSAFSQEMAQAGQTISTVTLFDLREGDFVGLHQDLFGELFFPFQAVLGLTAPGEDYRGGGLRLLWKTQAGPIRSETVHVPAGGLVVFPCSLHAGEGGEVTSVLHGVEKVEAGERRTLALLLHDSRPETGYGSGQ